MSVRMVLARITPCSLLLFPLEQPLNRPHRKHNCPNQYDDFAYNPFSHRLPKS